MKKFLLLIASVLLLYGSGFAGSPPDGNGTVSVEVVKHLALDVQQPLLEFTYNEFDANGGFPETDHSDKSTIILEANVDWAFGVCTVGGATVLVNQTKTTETIEASRFRYFSSEAIGSKYQLGPSTSYPILGDKDIKSFELYWDVEPDFTENLYAGNYLVGIIYKLVEQGTP